MKKLVITLTQELEVPDHFELVAGPDGALINTGTAYLNLGIEYMQAGRLSMKEMKFEPLDEAAFELVARSIVRETKDVREK